MTEAGATVECGGVGVIKVEISGNTATKGERDGCSPTTSLGTASVINSAYSPGIGTDS